MFERLTPGEVRRLCRVWKPAFEKHDEVGVPEIGATTPDGYDFILNGNGKVDKDFWITGRQLLNLGFRYMNWSYALTEDEKDRGDDMAHYRRFRDDVVHGFIQESLAENKRGGNNDNN